MAPITRPGPAPVVVAPANYQAPLPPSVLKEALEPYPMPPGTPLADDLYRQTDADVFRKSWGCLNCHQGVKDMHDLETVKLGCIDCHGGHADAPTKEMAHVHPCQPHAWPTSANPVRTYTLLNHEDPEFIRFVNPGDLRVAHISCGACHPRVG